jgi:hypothetical protein
MDSTQAAARFRILDGNTRAPRKEQAGAAISSQLWRILIFWYLN